MVPQPLLDADLMLPLIADIIFSNVNIQSVKREKMEIGGFIAVMRLRFWTAMRNRMYL